MRPGPEKTLSVYSMLVSTTSTTCVTVHTELLSLLCCHTCHLSQAGEKKWGTDESVFNQILCLRSFSQLRATFKAYASIAGHDIEQAIESEVGGDTKDGYLAIGQSTANQIATCILLTVNFKRAKTYYFIDIKNNVTFNTLTAHRIFKTDVCIRFVLTRRI